MFARRVVALLLVALAVVWFIEGVVGAWPELRLMFAAMAITTMILLLAVACITSSRPVKIVGCTIGALLGFREFVMLANSKIDLVEVAREPRGWVGPGLLLLFFISACISLAGWRNPRRP
jgi:hypothetical protein